MIAREIAEALDVCRAAGLVVATDRITCPGCDEDWWVPPEPRLPQPHARWLRRFADDHRDHAAASGAVPYEFTVLVEPAPTGDQVRAILGRCDDLGVGSSPRGGVGYLAVARRAEHLAGAIATAVRDIEALGLRPVHVDHDDPTAESVVDAVNLALLLRALAPRVEQMQVIQRLAAP